MLSISHCVPEGSFSSGTHSWLAVNVHLNGAWTCLHIWNEQEQQEATRIEVAEPLLSPQRKVTIWLTITFICNEFPVFGFVRTVEDTRSQTHTINIWRGKSWIPSRRNTLCRLGSIYSDVISNFLTSTRSSAQGLLEAGIKTTEKGKQSLLLGNIAMGGTFKSIRPGFPKCLLWEIRKSILKQVSLYFIDEKMQGTPFLCNGSLLAWFRFQLFQMF